MTTQLKSGLTAEPLCDEDSARILKAFPGHVDGLICVQPGGWILPTPYLGIADKIYDFKFRASDVVIMTHPRCGTTWTQELVWNMMHNPNNDNPEAEECISTRSPHLEMDMVIMGKMKELALSDHDSPLLKQFYELCPDANPADGPSIQITAAIPGVRIIKTHLAFPLHSPDLINTAKEGKMSWVDSDERRQLVVFITELSSLLWDIFIVNDNLDKIPRAFGRLLQELTLEQRNLIRRIENVVYVARNPKDMCVSFFHYCRMVKFRDFQGDMDLFIDLLTNDETSMGPYWNHVKEGWKRREHPNLYFLFYENLKGDPEAEVRKLNTFLGANLTEEQMKKVIDHASFDKMQARDAFFPVNNEAKKKILNKEVVQNEGGFFRKGQVGGFKCKLTPEQESKIDAWTWRNMEGMDIDFKYNI